jgi:hypothetical protein
MNKVQLMASCDNLFQNVVIRIRLVDLVGIFMC